MGTIEKGFLGGFRGKLGTAVGSTWKGISVIRSRPPRKRTAPATDLQLEAQAKFTLMANFLRPLDDLLNQTYKKSAVGMSGLNKAFSENKDAITGVAPAFTVDYPKVFLSRGKLPKVLNPVVASTVAGKLTFTWTDNSGITNKALSSDMVYVAAYSQELDEWVFALKAAARSAGTYTLDTAALSGKPVQTYMGVFTADGRTVSESLFAGTVNVL